MRILMASADTEEQQFEEERCSIIARNRGVDCTTLIILVSIRVSFEHILLRVVSSSAAIGLQVEYRHEDTDDTCSVSVYKVNSDSTNLHGVRVRNDEYY